MKYASGIYLKALSDNGNKLWYVFGVSNKDPHKSKIHYLHKNGSWVGNESTYGPDDTPDTEVHSGHYETREEAIATIKKYTMFRFIFDEEEKQIDIKDM